MPVADVLCMLTRIRIANISAFSSLCEQEKPTEEALGMNCRTSDWLASDYSRISSSRSIHDCRQAAAGRDPVSATLYVWLSFSYLAASSAAAAWI